MLPPVAAATSLIAAAIFCSPFTRQRSGTGGGGAAPIRSAYTQLPGGNDGAPAQQGLGYVELPKRPDVECLLLLVARSPLALISPVTDGRLPPDGPPMQEVNYASLPNFDPNAQQRDQSPQSEELTALRQKIASGTKYRQN